MLVNVMSMVVKNYIVFALSVESVLAIGVH